MVDPVVQQTGKQKGLGVHFEQASGKLVAQGEGGVDQAFNGAGGRAERRKDAHDDQQQPQDQPAVLSAEQGFAQQVKHQGEQQPAQGCKAGPKATIGSLVWRMKPDTVGLVNAVA